MHMSPIRVKEIVFAKEPKIQGGGAGPDATLPLTLTPNQ